jgi:hypothetical protein
VFTVRDVYAEMVAAGTRYVKSTVFKTMQRMKEPLERPPVLCMRQSGGGDPGDEEPGVGATDASAR